MDRSDQWPESQFFHVGISNPDSNRALVDAIENSPEKPHEPFTSYSLIGTARELILRIAEDNFELDIVGFTIDAKSGMLMLSRSFTATDLDDEGAKRTLAMAMMCGVPVYPEDDDAAIQLTRLRSSIMTDGFTAGEDGSKRYRWTGPQAIMFDPQSNNWVVDPTASVFPADALALAADVAERQRHMSEAWRVLFNLRAAIDELSEMLSVNIRDEGRLQQCLTRYPILFGLEYRSVTPKYRLGADFEMDFALEHYSGLVDLVEIEASNLQLYTKSGDPRKELVHAEQQVLDWLEWLEANARLARDDLPGLTRPIGQVIIGRRVDLSQADNKRLRRRNSAWKGMLIILTYDDLLARAQDLLRILTETHRAI